MRPAGFAVIVYLWVLFNSLWPAVLLHVLLAFPSGHLGTRLNRTFVISVYVIEPLVNLALLLGQLIASSQSAYRFLLEEVGIAGIPLPLFLPGALDILFLGLGALLILLRWLQDARARRRSLSPVLWSLVPIMVACLALPLALFGNLSAEWRTVLFNFVNPLFLSALPIGILVGLLRSGLDMSSVGSLVVKLSKGLLPEELQPALAQALNDPSLEVLYWIPTLDSFASLDGGRQHLPATDGERAASLLNGEDGPVAALVYDSSLLQEAQLVDTAAAAVRMALENARLQVQLRAQLDEVRRSSARLAEAAQQERQRVERDLHDGAQLQLAALLLSLQLTKAEAIRNSDDAAASLLDGNIVALKQALSELRELARGIYPSILTEAGLVPAVRSLAERSPIPVEVKGDAGEHRLPPPIEATLYFVAAEAITNSVKHSRAKHICLALERLPGSVAMDVSDDGQGGADPSAGTGLRGLSDRVAAVGGRLQVRSDNREGTTIRSEIPCA